MLDQASNDENAIAINNNKKKYEKWEEKWMIWLYPS